MKSHSGLAAGLSAYLLWGIFPIYFKLLSDVPPIEVLAHRIVWSVAFLALGSYLLKRARISRDPDYVPASITRRQMSWLAVSSLLIAVNWLVFITAVSSGYALEASFGYFINPLLIIALGTLVFRERLSRIQIISVSLATVGVLYQIISLGIVPWISLMLAISFGLYGMVRKIARVESVQGLFIETLFLSPLALVWLLLQNNRGQLSFGNTGSQLTLLLLAAGIVTSTPLVLFAMGVRRLPYSVMGFLQFINPSMQFIIAVFIFGEVLLIEKLISFIFVWVALALLLSGYRRPARTAETARTE